MRTAGQVHKEMFRLEMKIHELFSDSFFLK